MWVLQRCAAKNEQERRSSLGWHRVSTEQGRQFITYLSFYEINHLSLVTDLSRVSSCDVIMRAKCVCNLLNIFRPPNICKNSYFVAFCKRKNWMCSKKKKYISSYFLNPYNHECNYTCSCKICKAKNNVRLQTIKRRISI